MKLADFYAYTEQTFDSFCKQVIRNERTDALRELAYHAKNETVFSALTPVEMARLSMVDRIPEDIPSTSMISPTFVVTPTA